MKLRNSDQRWFSKDPLLAAAQVLLGIFMGLILVVLVLAALGAGAVVTVQRSEITAKLADAGLADKIGVWGIFAGLLALCLLLALAFRFAMELDRIIKSVDAGDPFAPENATRLTRLAWLALAIELLGTALTFGRTHFERLAGDTSPPVNMTGSLTGGIALVMTLFILARVFRKGTEMREDLEGTV